MAALQRDNESHKRTLTLLGANYEPGTAAYKILAGLDADQDCKRVIDGTLTMFRESSENVSDDKNTKVSFGDPTQQFDNTSARSIENVASVCASDANGISKIVRSTKIDCEKVFAILSSRGHAHTLQEYDESVMKKAVAAAVTLINNLVITPKNGFIEANPENCTLLPQRNTCSVPGCRFIENYYWDTFWSNKGLRVAGNTEQMRKNIQNIMDNIDAFGFMPNGTRSYYLDRSQPPVFSSMLRDYHRETGDSDFIRLAIPLMQIEREYWLSDNFKVEKGEACLGVHNKGLRVTISEFSDDGGTKFYVGDGATDENSKSGIGFSAGTKLSRYQSCLRSARPESLPQDLLMVRSVVGAQTELASSEEARLIFGHVRATAESGWDFSSRWAEDILNARMESYQKKDRHAQVAQSVTMNVVPCDLNALLYRLEVDLAYFHAVLGNGDQAAHWAQLAKQRRELYKLVFLDQTRGIFNDYYMQTQTVSPTTTAASYFPLWAGIWPDGITRDEALAALQPLMCSLGLATTTVTSEQQWDADAVWAPLQCTAVETLIGPSHLREDALVLGTFDPHYNELILSHSEFAKTNTEASIHLAANWLSSVLAVFAATGHFYEKYPSGFGREITGAHQKRALLNNMGGEYANQIGFGWTIGCFLSTLQFLSLL